MTEIARREYDATDLEMFEAIGLRPTDPKARAAVAIARRYDLDPVMKHVVVIPQAGPYITRDGYLFHAQRTGQLVGMDEVEAPEVVDVEGMGKVWRSKVAVYRKGHSKPYAFYGYFPVGRRGNEHKMARKDSERTGLIRAFGLTDVGGDDHYDDDAPQGQRPTVAEVKARAAQPPADDTADVLPDAFPVEDPPGGES